MNFFSNPAWTRWLLLVAFLLVAPPWARAQETRRLFPQRDLMPLLLAGPRDAGASFTVMAVPKNPNAHGEGVEVEVSLGNTIPVWLLAGEPGRNPVVVGIEAAVFARFGLQVLEREIINTDWYFAVPVVWHRDHGWFRFRYYHSSSHIGDEYARRFEFPGINFSRDSGDLLYFHDTGENAAVYGGVRYSYNPHPQESKRWVLRGGAQAEAPELDQRFRPFAAADVEWDQEAGLPVRFEFRAGVWLPKMGERRALRASLGVLLGATPLGQFHGMRTTQIGVSLQGNL